MNFEIISEKVTDWAKARQIIPNSNPMAQAMKGMEEAAEWLQAATAISVLSKDDPEYQHWLDKFKDGVGDTAVTLIISSALANVSVVECLNIAFNEIKDRKGTMNEKGIFVKEK